MISHLGFSQSIMGLHGGYDNRNSRERNKNEIVLTKKLSLSGASIDQNALRFSQMQYCLFIQHSFVTSSQKVLCFSDLIKLASNIKKENIEEVVVVQTSYFFKSKRHLF